MSDIPSAGTARPDAVTPIHSAEQVTTIRDRAASYPIIDRSEVVGLADSHEVLRRTLAEREAECETWEVLAEHQTWCAQCYEGGTLNCEFAGPLLREARKTSAKRASAAVAPAARETQETTDNG